MPRFKKFQHVVSIDRTLYCLKTQAIVVISGYLLLDKADGISLYVQNGQTRAIPGDDVTVSYDSFKPDTGTWDIFVIKHCVREDIIKSGTAVASHQGNAPFFPDKQSFCQRYSANL